MAKAKLRLKAKQLRKAGIGIKTIANKLKVSSSTVSLWCRDIELSEEQISELEKRAHDPYYGRRLANVKRQQKLRNDKIRKLFIKGKKDIGTLTTRELFIAGVCLYWAEGFKKDSQVGFSNSDPKMIVFFIQWLKRCCKIAKDNLSIRVGVNESYKTKISGIEEYWSRFLKIPLEQFQKPFFQKVVWKKLYDQPETYHGVLRIRVKKSTDLLRMINGWIAGIKGGL